MPTAIESVEALREHVGRDVAVSDWFEVAQERIGAFADATGDRQWIHVDPERAARESPFGGTIAHGFLTLSLLSELSRRALTIRGVRMGVNYGLNRVRFVAPVPAGSRIRGRFALVALEEVRGGGAQATWDVTIEREGGEKPCCVAEWLVRYYA
jgi:acyl dehydratase